MAGSEKKLILAADNSAFWTEGLAQYLPADDFVIEIARDGLQALQLVDQGQVSLLVTEYDLPEISGPQLIEMIRAKAGQEHLPVIIYTDKPRETWQSDVVRTCQGAFLKYEVDVKELAETIRKNC